MPCMKGCNPMSEPAPCPSLVDLLSAHATDPALRVLFYL